MYVCMYTLIRWVGGIGIAKVGKVIMMANSLLFALDQFSGIVVPVEVEVNRKRNLGLTRS